MRDIRPALRTWLLADSTISTQVGATRIYPVKLPQAVTGASLVYNRISGRGDYHMQGASGLLQVRMQIDAWATSHDSAVTLANLVKDRLDALRHTRVTWGSNSPTDEILLQGAFMESERDEFDDVAELYRVSRDYLIWYGDP